MRPIVRACYGTTLLVAAVALVGTVWSGPSPQRAAACAPAACAPAATPTAPPVTATPAPAPTPSPDPRVVGTCGTQLCWHGGPWRMYGASEYESTSAPPQSGIDNVQGTVDLARRSRLNTIRIIDFFDARLGDPAREPYNPARWVKVDRMIAGAAAAGIEVLLDLSNYRDILWNSCIDPYGYDWSGFLGFVASRVNSVTGTTYRDDPAIALVAMAGEPADPGVHQYVASASNRPCTVSYTSDELTAFYARTLSMWRSLAPHRLVTNGELGGFDLPTSIDWKAIYALPDNDVCGMGTYGGMIDMVPAVASYCGGLRKPWMDIEWGYAQTDGDASRARAFQSTYDACRGGGAAGTLFWNLGDEVQPHSYDVGPGTPLTLATIQRNAPS